MFDRFMTKNSKPPKKQDVSSQQAPGKLFKKSHSETDGPWQEILECFFKPFIDLCFPAWSKQIHWEKGYKALKGELPSKEGKQICDMLFEVELLNGQQKIIFLHLEIQGQKQKDFAYRMLSYNFAILKKHRKPIVSVAIFLDGNPSWRPHCFEQIHPFTNQPYFQFFFDTLKILDYRGQEEKLRQQENIFSLVLLAQLAVMEAKNDQELRKKKKTALTRELFTRGLNKDIVSKLYKFIDWLIKLEPNYMNAFKEEVKHAAGRESWQDWDPVYVSTFEQVAKIQGREAGLQEGRQEGRQEGLRSVLDKQLRRRFPHDITTKHLHLINDADSETLSMWAENLMDAKNIDEVFATTRLAHS